MAEVVALRPDLLSDSAFAQLAAVGATRVEVRALGRLWTASTVRDGHRVVCEGYAAHVALRRLHARLVAVSAAPEGPGAA